MDVSEGDGGGLGFSLTWFHGPWLRLVGGSRASSGLWLITKAAEGSRAMGSWLRIKEWGLFPTDKPPAVEQGLCLAPQTCRPGLRRGGRRWWVHVRLLPVMDPFWGGAGTHGWWLGQS